MLSTSFKPPPLSLTPLASRNWPKKNALGALGKNVAMFIHFQHATYRWLPSFFWGGSKMIEVQVARLLKAGLGPMLTPIVLLLQITKAIS